MKKVVPKDLAGQERPSSEQAVGGFESWEHAAKEVSPLRIREKWLREGTCEVCNGKGAVPVGLGWFARLDPLYWEVCPECNGEGVVFPVYEEPYLWTEDLRPRPPFVEEELKEWVQAYREARRAKLPPEEAAKVASLAVYGPLPF